MSPAPKKFLKKKYERPQEYAEKIKNHELSRDWKEVIDKLGLKVKESDAAEIGVFASIFETAPVFDFLSSTSPSTIKDKMRKYVRGKWHI